MRRKLIILMFINILLLSGLSFALDYKDEPIIMTTGIGKDLRFYLSPDISENELINLVQKFKEMGITYVQFYDIMPEYGKPYTEKEYWIHPRNDFYKKKGLKADIVISKEKIKSLISLLHKNNIKAIYYDEICSKNDKFKIYTPIFYPNTYTYYSLPYFFKEEYFNKKKNALSIYGLEYGYDGNIELIKEKYTNELYKFVKEVGFDGIFLDSLSWLCEATSFGYTYEGRKINKTPDDICSDFIKSIKNKLGKDFLVIGNNGFYKNPLYVFNKTKKIIDLWNVELPGGELVKKVELYPKTFSQLNDYYSKGYYNIVIYQPFFDTNNVYNYELLIALAFSNGVNVYHKNDYLANNYLKDSIKRYNNFLLKNKNAYFPQKKMECNIDLEVYNNLLYNCYETKDFIVINLFNVNRDSPIWAPEKISSNTKISFKTGPQLCSLDINYLTPDELKNVVIVKKIDNNKCEITISVVKTWLTLIIKGDK